MLVSGDDESGDGGFVDILAGNDCSSQKPHWEVATDCTRNFYLLVPPYPIIVAGVVLIQAKNRQNKIRLSRPGRPELVIKCKFNDRK